MLARALMLASLLATPVLANESEERLDELAVRLQAVEKSYSEQGEMDLDALSSLALQLEDVLREMRDIERGYDGERRAIEDEFYSESEDLMALIGFISTFESQSAPSFLLHPEGPAASIQANVIVDSLMQDLQSRIAVVASRLQTWREIQEREDALQASATQAFTTVNDLRTNIVEYDRGNEPKRVVDEPMVLDAVYAVSENLNDFLIGLDQIDSHGPEPTKFSMEAHRGELELPVSGPAAPYRDGVSVVTRDSFVATPVAGTVRFRAVFLDYGNMVIIEPETGFLLVLAGMDSLAVEEGEILQAGDIIGFFSTDVADNAESDGSPLRLPQKSLYVETRKDNIPVKVMDYFREKQD